LRAILDPNVVVSSLLSSGTTAAVLDAWLERRAFELIVCPTLLAELEEVLDRPKFSAIRRELVAGLLGRLRSEADYVDDPAVQPGATADPDDDYLVALARLTHADCLVSGDPHLTSAAVPDVVILTPAQFLRRIGPVDQGPTP
jgi:putative PIN family toxin of toxin-antitoxin system